MGGSQACNYLLSISGFYRKNGAEKYILSRLTNIENIPIDVQALFCRKCLIFYIPVVNCVTELTEEFFSVKCNTCSSTTRVEMDIFEEPYRPVNDADHLDFEDLFI